MSNSITVLNGSDVVTLLNGAEAVDFENANIVHCPPDAPLNMAGLEVLFESMQALSTPPEGISEGDIYLDDGTNTKSGERGFRQYISNTWIDFGLQEAEALAIDGGVWE